jgi:hypothetical protein
MKSTRWVSRRWTEREANQKTSPYGEVFWLASRGESAGGHGGLPPTSVWIYGGGRDEGALDHAAEHIDVKRFLQVAEGADR